MLLHALQAHRTSPHNKVNSAKVQKPRRSPAPGSEGQALGIVLTSRKRMKELLHKAFKGLEGGD